MLKIFLSSHGSMASGMQSSLKILMGECENLTVFDAYLDESCVQDHLDAFYETVGPEDEVLLCSDLYGGSVNQAMFHLSGPPKHPAGERCEHELHDECSERGYPQRRTAG